MNKMAEESLQLVVGKEYSVDLFHPRSRRGREVPSARYLGEGDLGNEKAHIFSFEENKEKTYIIANDRHIKRSSVVTSYIRPAHIGCSFYILKKHVIPNLPDNEKSQLINILNQLGEQI